MPRGRGVHVGTILGEGMPLKIWEGKKVQNSARFLTTFEFNRKYLRKRSTYRKSEKNLINYNPSHVGRKNDCELWSTNKKVLDLHVDPSELNFSTDYISALTGCWPLKFLHALQTCREAGVFIWALFLGGKAHPLIFGKAKKRLKFSAISDNFRV